MKDIILTALTRDELAALFDHRIDLAFQRHATKAANKPTEASQTYAEKRPTNNAKSKTA